MFLPLKILNVYFEDKLGFVTKKKVSVEIRKVLVLQPYLTLFFKWQTLFYVYLQHQMN